MRVKITIEKIGKSEIIPYNYTVYLQAAIYHIIKSSDDSYAEFLHNTGYQSDIDKRNFKMFVYSDLIMGRRIPIANGFKVFNSRFEWYISSPIPDFLNNLVNGLFRHGHIFIGKEKFEFRSVETLAEPIYSSKMTFKCISPVTLTITRDNYGKIRQHYLRPEDGDLWTEAMYYNLSRKYYRIYGKLPDKDGFHFEFDLNYIERKGRAASRFLKFKRGQTEETDIKAVFAPFKIEGPPELIKTGYEAGFGARNSLGFGMAAVL